MQSQSVLALCVSAWARKLTRYNIYYFMEMERVEDMLEHGNAACISLCRYKKEVEFTIEILCANQSLVLLRSSALEIYRKYICKYKDV